MLNWAKPLTYHSTQHSAFYKKYRSILRRRFELGVGTSVYYPQPVPRLAYYRNKYGSDLSLYPNAARISDQSIALPVGPHLARGDVEYIAAMFGRAYKENR